MSDEENAKSEGIDVAPDVGLASDTDMSMDVTPDVDDMPSRVSTDDDMDGTEEKSFFQKAPFLVGLFFGSLALLLVIFVSSPSKNDQVDMAAPVIVDVSGQPEIAEKEEETEAEALIEAAQEETPSEEAVQLVEEAPPAAIPTVAEAAILITDVGLKVRIAKAIAEQLPTEMSIAVSSYSGDVSRTISAFKATGRDVWFQIASQSLKPGIDPGPFALSNQLGLSDNQKLLERQLSTTSEKFIGLYIPSDADITQDPDQWQRLAGNVLRDLMILDGTKAKVATGLYVKKAADQVSAYLKADIIIPGNEGPKVMRDALTAAIPVILKQQEAIIVVQEPTTLTIDMLASWIKSFPSKGIALVPASKFTGLKP